MDPCTEVLSRMWLATLNKITPQRTARASVDENMLLAKYQTEKDMQNMEQRRAALEKQIADITTQTHTLLRNKDQRAARMAIARRRRLNAQLSQVYEMIASLETTLDNYSSSETSVALLEAFKNSTRAISTWQKNAPVYTPEDADTIRQEFDEQIQAANEVAQIAAQPLYAQSGAPGIADLTIEEMMEELEDEPRPPAHTVETKAPLSTVHMQDKPHSVAIVTEDEPEDLVPLLTA